jgi:hypothetical protein
MARPLRCGVVAPITTDVPAWPDQLRGLADSGYSTILMPDVPQWQPRTPRAGRRPVPPVRPQLR